MACNAVATIVKDTFSLISTVSLYLYTSYSDAQMLRSDDFHDDNHRLTDRQTDETDIALPLAHARGVIMHEGREVANVAYDSRS